MKKRNGTIELLKFIFAMLVMGVHTSFFTDINIAQSGQLGVDFFFMVSGYFAAKSINNESKENSEYNTLSFCKKRILGFYPYYLTSVLFDIVLLSTINWVDIFTIPRMIRRNIFEIIPLQVFGFRSEYASGVQWYVGTMFILVPVVYLLYKKYRKIFSLIISPIVAFFLFGITIYFADGLRNPGYMIGGLLFLGLLRGFANISLGTFIFDISAHLKKKSELFNITKLKKIIVYFTELTLLIGTTGYCIVHKSTQNDCMCVILIAFLLIMIFTFNDGLTIFDNSFVYSLGKISSVVFMIHIAVGKAIAHYLVGIDTRIIIILYYIISIILAYFLQKIVSKIMNLSVIRRLI